MKLLIKLWISYIYIVIILIIKYSYQFSCPEHTQFYGAFINSNAFILVH